ncbi:hypothetical protein CEXT_287411 [Caerostris extrusa]|uniref:Uncharacterized protein n=1 Tax=Caerostris extrusa TaxID=172846 RepID=A0AAV4PW93_CAEEX|nr:hypothetical protein CEXT_287411 [Caerostris extrusa]
MKVNCSGKSNDVHANEPASVGVNSFNLFAFYDSQLGEQCVPDEVMLLTSVFLEADHIRNRGSFSHPLVTLFLRKGKAPSLRMRECPGRFLLPTHG